ncbi:substrate-binding domain-containing protein [Marinobacterium sp. xm-m-383]|uniref:substrate-binding domain-containing protein n=1 Tax=unclassified Marinobacterium TaxID=2644139 RepID=UPI00352C6B95
MANNFQNPAYLEIFDIFTRLLQEKGLRTLLVNLTDETDPQRSLDLLSQYQVDAVVVATSTLPVEFSSAFSQAGLPVVHAFGRDHQGDYDVVGIDNFSAGAMGAQRLLQAGYSDIGFLGGPQFSTSTNDRLNGFLSVVDSAPHVRKRVAFADAYTFEAGNKAMHGLIEGKLSQGYFCGDDMIAIGAISALEASRISVPEQVGIIGFNNIQMAGWENIQLTTISQPVTEIVEITVDRLLSQLEQGVGFKPCLTLLPCEIVERNSMPKL